MKLILLAHPGAELDVRVVREALATAIEAAGATDGRAVGFRLTPVASPTAKARELFDEAAGTAGALAMLWLDGGAVEEADAVKVAAALASPAWSWVFPVREKIQVGPAPRPRFAPGVVKLGLVLGRPEFSREVFAHRFVDVHGPMALAKSPMFHRYVANIVTDPAIPWDGFVEQEFADLDVWMRHDRRVMETDHGIELRQDMAEAVAGSVHYVGEQVAELAISQEVRELAPVRLPDGMQAYRPGG